MTDPLTERERKDREADDRAHERALQAEHEEWERRQDYEIECSWWWDEP